MKKATPEIRQQNTLLEEGTPSGYLPSIDNMDPDAFYAWVPVTGTSMTCDGPKSIPDGSIALIKDMGFRGNENQFLAMPLRVMPPEFIAEKTALEA